MSRPHAFVSNTVVEEDSSLLDSDLSEIQLAPLPKPADWNATIENIKRDPKRHSSVIVSGVRKLNGVYTCMGVKNERPYYKKTNADIVIWHDSNEDIWTLTGMSGLKEKDPELYGYIHSNAWDVTKLSNEENWHIADAQGEWMEIEEMRVEKHEQKGGLLSSLLTHPTPESRQAAHAAVEQSVSLMSCFWGDFKKVKARTKENTKNIKELRSNQEQVRDKQQQILSRIEKLEKQREQNVYEDLVKKIEMVEGQIRVLSTNQEKKTKNKSYKISKQSVEELIQENKLEKASLKAMRTFLRKKQRQQVLIDGEAISITGSKKELLSRIRQLLDQPERRASKKTFDEKQNSELEKRKERQKARKLRAIARQRKKEQMDSRGRESKGERYRSSKRRKKDNMTHVDDNGKPNALVKQLAEMQVA